MGRRMEQLMPLVSLPVADSVLGYVGATVTNSMRLLARDTPLSIDRVQGARLYGGMLEVRRKAAFSGLFTGKACSCMWHMEILIGRQRPITYTYVT